MSFEPVDLTLALHQAAQPYNYQKAELGRTIAGLRRELVEAQAQLANALNIPVKAPDRWQIRAVATGGGPCETCGVPRFRHVCIGCSPTGDTPGSGCINCRQTGWDQTPCLPPHRWTRHGHRCCDEASEERPAWADATAKCGGPAICVACKTERAEMAGHVAAPVGGLDRPNTTPEVDH